MANLSIPDLPQAIGVPPSAQLWANIGGTDYKVTAAQVAAVSPVATTTVSALPSPSSALIGATAFVTDATASTYSIGAAVTGGGSHVIPVFCNGNSWVAG